MQLYIWLTKATALNGTNVYEIVMSFSPSTLSTWAMLRGGKVPTLVLFKKTAPDFKMSLSTTLQKTKNQLLMEIAWSTESFF